MLFEALLLMIANQNSGVITGIRIYVRYVNFIMNFTICQHRRFFYTEKNKYNKN